jgi:hypothetical protein
VIPEAFNLSSKWIISDKIPQHGAYLWWYITVALVNDGESTPTRWTNIVDCRTKIYNI